MTFNEVDIRLLVPMLRCDVCDRATFYGAGFGPAGDQPLKQLPAMLKLAQDPDPSTAMPYPPRYAATNPPTAAELEAAAIKEGWRIYAEQKQLDIPSNPEAPKESLVICPKCIKIMYVVSQMVTPEDPPHLIRAL
jgi:hypothetical protein